MENLVTPSERAQSLINPNCRIRTESESPHDKLILALKIILGTPIPVLLTLYVCGLAISEIFLELVAGLTCVLTFFYILVDRFSPNREFRFFLNMTDLPLIAFALVCSSGTLLHWHEPESLAGVLEIGWILAFYLLSYSLFLFPGLNRLFQSFSAFVPLVCLFVIWQKFYGLTINFSFLPGNLAHAVAGIDTVGLFNSVSPYAFAVGSFICFGTAALCVNTSRPNTFKIGILAAITIAWLSLVTIQSAAVLVGVLASVLAILLYCQRTYFFLLSLLVAVFVFAVPEEINFVQSLSPWMERGMDMTQQKREIAKAELQMFQDNPWLGVGYGPHQTRLPEYFEKLEIPRQTVTTSSNNYFAILASTGLVGFLLFTLITLSFFLKTHRLWLEIPRTHYWHRAFVMGCLGAQVIFHVLGLYQTMIGSLSVMLILAFFLAVINYLNESYSRGIIPDDYSL